MHPDQITARDRVCNGIGEDLVYALVCLPGVFVEAHTGLVVQDWPGDSVCSSSHVLIVSGREAHLKIRYNNYAQAPCR